MSDRVLVDTSSWVEWSRAQGDEKVRDRVNQLIDDRLALTCPMVWLELWSGVRGDAEKKKLRDMENRAPDLDVTAEIWEDACELALIARSKGATVPASDLLIFSCAKHHGVEIEACDRHFDLLARL